MSGRPCLVRVPLLCLLVALVGRFRCPVAPGFSPGLPWFVSCDMCSGSALQGRRHQNRKVLDRYPLPSSASACTLDGYFRYSVFTTLHDSAARVFIAVLLRFGTSLMRTPLPKKGSHFVSLRLWCFWLPRSLQEGPVKTKLQPLFGCLKLTTFRGAEVTFQIIDVGEQPDHEQYTWSS